MSESRVLRARINKMPKTKLTDTSKPLKLLCLDQPEDELVLRFEANQVVDWIAEYLGKSCGNPPPLAVRLDKALPVLRLRA